MNGRIEAAATLTSQQVSADIGGGPVVVSFPNGEYFATDFVQMFEARLEAVLGVGFAVSAVLTEAGSGRLTVARDSGTVKILFGSLELANLCGVAAVGDWNAAPAASFTAAAGLQNAWLPDAPMSEVDPLTDGFLLTNAGYLTSPTGDLSVRVGSGHNRHQGVTWSHVRRARAVDGADAALVSWGQFVRITQFEGSSLFAHSAGGQPPAVRVYRDATANVLFGTGDGEYRMRAARDLAMPRPVNNFLAYYTVTIPELKKL